MSLFEKTYSTQTDLMFRIRWIVSTCVEAAMMQIKQIHQLDGFVSCIVEITSTHGESV